MSKLTCKQFAAYDKDNMSIIMMWLEGYTPRRRGCHHRLRQDGRRHCASDRLLRRPSWWRHHQSRRRGAGRL